MVKTVTRVVQGVNRKLKCTDCKPHTNLLCALSAEAGGTASHDWSIKNVSELFVSDIPVSHDVPSTQPSGEELRASLLTKM